MGKKENKSSVSISDGFQQSSTDAEKPISTGVSCTDKSFDIDKINNVSQKEEKLFISGVTRGKYMAVIAAGFDAVKEVEVMKADGSWKKEMVPDVGRRQWACEKAMELFGDKVSKVENTITTDMNDKDRALLEKLTGVPIGVSIKGSLSKAVSS